MKLYDVVPDDDPVPRPAPVGPGSAYAAVARAVLVTPSAIEQVKATVGPRDERVLRTWRFTAAGTDVKDRLVVVPHVWSRAEPELSHHKGPCEYERRVNLRPGRHHQLRFGALDYVASVALDGHVVGHHEGGFTPVAFDVPAVPEAGDVVVAVRVDDPVEPALLGPNPLTDPKRKVKGVFEFHDSRPGGHSHGLWFGPEFATLWGTGGMVEPAMLVATGPVRIDAAFVAAGAGTIRLSWVLVNLEEGELDIEVVADVAGAGLRVAATVPPGPSRLSVRGRFDDAEPWQPTAGAGHHAAVHTLATEVRVRGGASDAVTVTFGVRSVDMPLEPDDQFRLRVDGRRLYVRAVNHIPGVWVPELSEHAFRTDLELAAAAGVNSVGLHAHVLPDRFYDAADAAGMLVYQDFPLNLAHDPAGAPLFDGGPTMAEASLLLAAELTYHLFNHPSVVYWCGHNEPAYQLAEVFGAGRSAEVHPDLAALGQALRDAPDEEALDDARVEQWRAMDPTRPAFKASGLGRHRAVGDTHTYSGSLNTDPTTTIARTAATFLSEFGAWTTNFSAERDVPGAAGDWPPSPEAIGDWEQRTHVWLGTATKTGRPDRYPDYGTFTFASQLWAGAFIKLGVESFRRRKWSPFGGHRYHLFLDHWGDAGAGVVDRHRLRQAHYGALAAAHRVVLPVVEALPSMRCEPGAALAMPTWVCSDRAEEIEGWQLAWSVRRLAPEDAWVIGVDDPKSAHRFGDPVVPWKDLVVLPRTDAGVEIASGVMTDGTVAGDGVAAGPVVACTPDAEGAYVVVLRLELPGRERVSNWGAFVAAPASWDPAPGITPMPRFSLAVRGGPHRVVHRWRGSTVDPGGGLPPGQYLVIGDEGRTTVPVDLFGDVDVDLASGSVRAQGALPWPFEGGSSPCAC